ncbi:MAG: D-glycerate dehydrogenase [Rhodothermales bacterium]
MKVVVTRPIPLAGLASLSEHDVVVHDFGSTRPSEKQLIEIGRDADALITLLSDPITRHVLEGCPNLKIVAQYAVGYDNIDLPAAKELGIAVTNTPGVLTDATADFAFALLLAAARKIPAGDRYVREGRFVRWETDVLLGTDLKGKTIGIVGLGRIGSAMARRALGFGMRVIYHNRQPANPTLERMVGAKYVSFERLLQESDVLSLHCSLNEWSHHLINESVLEKMRPTAILINTARGTVVDEAALVNALRIGRIAAAGLDVFELEPQVNAGLLELDNVVLAPHLGSATVEARTRMAEMCSEAVLAAFNGMAEIPHRVA